MVIIKSLYLLKILNQQTYTKSEFIYQQLMQNIQSNELNSQVKIIQTLKNGFYNKFKVKDLYQIKEPYIDKSFQHSQDSIKKGASIKPHLWIPAEELHHQPSYSSQLKNIEQIKFSKKSINQALMILNWFVPNVFDQIINRQINFNHFYYFDVLNNGVIQQIKIDSYVPVDALHNQELFAKNYQGSIFPCIYQKMLAKVYGDYNSISEDFIQLVQIQSAFCREEIPISKIKDHQNLMSLKKKLIKKINQKNIIFFKTRNSVRLSSFGLQPNCCYLITRLIQFQEEKYGIIQFLQMKGPKWIGKYSKLRSNWHLQQQFVQQNNLNLFSVVKQNYMSFQDMKGIARDIIILNNTQNYHKTWIQSEVKNNYSTTSIRNQEQILNYYTFSIKQRNKIVLKLSSLKLPCRSSIIMIKVQGQQLSFTNKNLPTYSIQAVNQLLNKQNFQKTYGIVKMSFKDNKTSNYLQLQCQSGRYIIAVIIQHEKNKGAHHVLTLFTNMERINIQSLILQQYPTQTKLKDPLQTKLKDPLYLDIKSQILNQSFVKFIENNSQKNSSLTQKQFKDNVIIKQLYQSCGLGFILLRIQKNADFYLKIELNIKKMKQNNVFPLNDVPSIKEVKQNEHYLFIFKLYWSKIQKDNPNSNIFHSFKPVEQKLIQQKQKTIFPPFQSVKITKIYEK